MWQVTEVPVRMICEIDRGAYVTLPDESRTYVPPGTTFFVEAWAGGGWYRGRLWNDLRHVLVHAADLGLPGDE